MRPFENVEYKMLVCNEISKQIHCEFNSKTLRATVLIYAKSLEGTNINYI